MGADSVAEYVELLNHEVYKYTVTESNHGKAARRLYNIFRITGRYAEAAYMRELFDEPVGALYQLAALLRTVDDAADSPENFEADALVREVDGLIMSAIGALDGPSEAEMVGRLLHLRDAVAHHEAEEPSTRAGAERPRGSTRCWQSMPSSPARCGRSRRSASTSTRWPRPARDVRRAREACREACAEACARHAREAASPEARPLLSADIPLMVYRSRARGSPRAWPYIRRAGIGTIEPLVTRRRHRLGSAHCP